MQNITQTVRFPVSSIIPSPVDDSIRELMLKTREARRTLDGIPEKAPSAEYFVAWKALADQLDEVTPNKLRKEVVYFGAKRLSDDVNVNMKLGTALFDIYIRMTPEPQAPLAKLIWRKKNAELAEIFDSDDFTIPDYAMGAIRRALLDESVWASLSLSAWVDLEDGVPAENDAPKKYQYFSISPKGTRYFSKILEAAAELVYTEELKDAK